MRYAIVLSAAFCLAAACSPGSKQPGSTSVLASAAPSDSAGAQEWLPQRDVLCPKGGTWEEINPQGRLLRAGCLQRFFYFHADDGALPPSDLPSVVTGNHSKYGDHVKVEVRRDGTELVVRGPGDVEIARVPYYELLVETDAGAINPCSAELTAGGGAPGAAEGQHDGRAVAVPGYWNPKTGEYSSAGPNGQKVLTFACASGVVTKCMQWGYTPWATFPREGGAPLADHFQACAHAAAAHYLTGTSSYTCDGRRIDFIDNLGIQRAAADPGNTLKVEAGWGKDGPVCISRTRYPACKEELKDKLAAIPACPEEIRPGAPWPEGVLLFTRMDDAAKDVQKCPARRYDCEGLALGQPGGGAQAPGGNRGGTSR